MPKFEGLIAAPFTAMHPDGSVNLAMIEVQAKSLVRDGVRGAFVCGTTGEGLSLTVEERREVAAAWRKAAPSDFALFVHVGHAAVAEAQALAEHAVSIGADAVAAMPSSPFASGRVEEVARYAAAIASAAPELPFFYYHIPSVSNVRISIHDLLAHAGPRIPNLAGVKFTHEDLMDYARSAALGGGRYDILFGRDEIYLAGLVFGTKAAVGSTYNFAAPLFHALTDAFCDGDLATAQRLQYALQEIVAIVIRFHGLAAQKHAMRAFGQDLGPVRAPARALAAEEAERLDGALAAIDFAGLCRGDLGAVAGLAAAAR